MKKHRTAMEQVIQPAENRESYSQLIESNFDAVEDEKSELIEYIQESFGKGRNEVESMFIGYN
jgi:hypothetical protein